ncbi:MAG: ParA family protein [Candidatus Odinarchaeota archaeon]
MSRVINSQIIMVHSYKGGTGKTAVAINLARYLAIKEKKKVLLIEQDTHGSSFTSIFRVKVEKTWNDFYNRNSSIKELITSHSGLDLICARAQDIEIPQDQSPKVFYARQLERLNMQKKSLLASYDHVILDTRPGYTIELINSISIADTAILLTRLDADTVEKTIDMYNDVYTQFKDRKIILVQNQVPEPVEVQMEYTIDLDVEKAMEQWSKFIENKPAVVIPLENEIAYMLSRSKLVPISSTFIKYIQQIAELVK